MNKTIWSYQNEKRTTTLSFEMDNTSIFVSYFSIFDLQTKETDTFTIGPFAFDEFKKALMICFSTGEICIHGNNTIFEIKEESEGEYRFRIEREVNSNTTIISGIPIDISNLLEKIELAKN